MDDKRRQLVDLAKLRQRTCWEGYHRLAEYHNGAYECDWVSPYSKTAGNLDASVFVLLQDWSSHERLSSQLDVGAATLGHTPSLPTNRNLIRLLRDTLELELDEVFATNLFPFVKSGGISARIPMADLVRGAREFALPQIQVIQPALVVCLGLVTFNAIRQASNLSPITPISTAIESPFKLDGPLFWCQAHTGARGQNSRGRQQVVLDWLRMRSRLHQ